MFIFNVSDVSSTLDGDTWHLYKTLAISNVFLTFVNSQVDFPSLYSSTATCIREPKYVVLVRCLYILFLCRFKRSGIG